jgi:hypothetical protein
VYPALLPLNRTPRLPVVDWTDAPADLNGLVRFAERRNLVSARVPSHFRRSLRLKVTISQQHKEFSAICNNWRFTTVFTTALHCRYSEPIHPVNLTPISFFIFHLFSKNLFLLDFTSKLLYAYVTFSMWVSRVAHLLFLVWWPWELQVSYNFLFLDSKKKVKQSR